MSVLQSGISQYFINLVLKQTVNNQYFITMWLNKLLWWKICFKTIFGLGKNNPCRIVPSLGNQFVTVLTLTGRLLVFAGAEGALKWPTTSHTHSWARHDCRIAETQNNSSDCKLEPMTETSKAGLTMNLCTGNIVTNAHRRGRLERQSAH